MYFSPLYGQIYYNGYGWNFYYQRGDYYADTANAPIPERPFNWGAVIGVCLCITCICVFAAYQKKQAEEEHSEHEEEIIEERTVVETTSVEGGPQRAYAMGS